MATTTYREEQEADFRQRERREGLVVVAGLLVLMLVVVAGLLMVPGWVVETWAGSSAGAPEHGGAGVSRAGGGH